MGENDFFFIKYTPLISLYFVERGGYEIPFTSM